MIKGDRRRNFPQYAENIQILSKWVKVVNSPKKRIVWSFSMTRKFFFLIELCSRGKFLQSTPRTSISSSRIKRKYYVGLISVSYLSASAAFKSTAPFSISVLFSPSCESYGQDKADQHLKEQSVHLSHLQLINFNRYLLLP